MATRAQAGEASTHESNAQIEDPKFAGLSRCREGGGDAVRVRHFFLLPATPLVACTAAFAGRSAPRSRSRVIVAQPANVSYGSEDALAIAWDLDSKIKDLLRECAV